MASIVLMAGAKFIATSFALNAFASALLVTGASLIGSYIDNKLFGKTIRQEGPRLDEVRFTGSSHTAVIGRVGGRFRIAGNIIWATRYREEIVTETQSAGGKGSGGGKVKSTTYNYYVSFAIGLCEGPIHDIGRIWADGKPLDGEDFTIRLYYGDNDQDPDPKIVAVEGAAFTPAYRGLAYLVFEELHLEEFGNRIPQINVEVTVSNDASIAGYEALLRGVDLIPSSGEFCYGVTPVYVEDDDDTKVYENRHIYGTSSDLMQSIDKLLRAAPNCTRIALVAAWHGADLRCSQCALQPRVEADSDEDGKVTKPYAWKVSGIDRSDAIKVSVNADDGTIYLGGAVADRAVYEAMVYLKDRGFEVIFYPFILMDIPPNNTLNNPYTNTEGQPVFPWRGRITLDLAPGVSGTTNRTSAARTEVEAFFGTCQPSDFSGYGGNTNDTDNDSDLEGFFEGLIEHITIPDPPAGTLYNTIKYTGPDEWTFRRMILHYAALCASVPGGIDGFFIGSEMVGLNQIQDDTGAFPAVDEFVALAADVRSMLGPDVIITYGADWSEWTNYRPDDGSNDVWFHLDDLWASSDIDVIAIDNYMPLADWRPTADHLDAENYDSIYDLAYLQSNIAGGEGYDWYYASENDRDNQTRTAINDAAYGEHWVFRPKDLVGWWQNAHYNRPGGVKAGSPTAWVPESKPIWFSELGCPAVQLGPNQPNVFYGPKSSESFFPYYSNGARDDYVQRQFNKAHMTYWIDNQGTALNPTGMVDPDHIFIWTWDARPFPEFPSRTDVWSDSDNWRLGHWLNGRLAIPEISDYILALFAEVGLGPEYIDVSEVYGLVNGFAVTQTNTIRDMLDPIMFVNLIQSYESDGKLRFNHKGKRSVETIDFENLIAGDQGENNLGGPVTIERSDDLELPEEVRIAFIEDTSAYEGNVAYYRNPLGHSNSVSESNVNVLLDFAYAEDLCARLLQEVYIAREQLAFKMPPSMLRFDPTDVIDLNVYGQTYTITLEAISEEYLREVNASKFDPDVFTALTAAAPKSKVPAPVVTQGTVLEILNLPMLLSSASPSGVYFAAGGKPWGSGVAVMRSPDDETYQLDVTVSAPSIIGLTDFDLAAGPTGRWDHGTELYVTTNATGTLETVSKNAVFQGYNAGALYNANVQQWEVIQWMTAEAVGTNRYKLTNLLRGQLGTERAIGDPLPAGSRFVVLDSSRIVQSTGGANLIGLTMYWKFGDALSGVDSDNWKTATAKIKGYGYRPYSPCSLKATKDYDTGNILLKWKRRTRFDGDIWDDSDVPLNESIEKYEVDIYDGSTVVRTITVTNESATVYTSAMQNSDFGGVQSSLKFRVFQISDTFGRGQGRLATITFAA